MNLIIVESPTKEKTISKFLSEKEYIIKSSYGHIRDLPKNELGIDIKKNFMPKYIVLPKAKKIIQHLSELSKKASNIFLATDFDREGEAIAWHLVFLLNLDNKAKRITFHEITPEAINNALKNPRDISMELVNAQQARRILDRLVGYKLSPLLWKKVLGGLSAGRVQSVAVRFICDREEEIKNFIPQEYWTVKVELMKDNKKFFADLVAIEDKKLQKLDIKTQQEVKKIIENIDKKNFIVKEIIKKDSFKASPSPFTTALLQQESSRQLRFSPSKTMFIAQQLYEGINLGGNSQIGLITYMRTDSMNISEMAQKEALKYIEENIGKEYIPEKVKKYKTKLKTAQEAHEAIRPTSVFRVPQNIKQYLTQEQYSLYEIIWKRFIASQMKDAVYDTTTVDITAGELSFRAIGRTIKFLGFMKIYTQPEDEDKKNIILPELSKGDTLKFLNCIPEQHFTEPPSRFTEATLIKELEKNGIGRPSTYAPIVDTIKQRRYVVLKEHKFYPTELGITVNELLKKYFSEIVDIKFTAKLEEKLDKIAQGKAKWENIIKEFYMPFENNLKNAEINISKQKVVVEKKCPKCGSEMVLKTGKFGKFLACSKWPECKTSISLKK